MATLAAAYAEAGQFGVPDVVVMLGGGERIHRALRDVLDRHMTSVRLITV